MVNNIRLIKRVAEKYAAVDLKKALEKLLKDAEKELKAFVRSFPPEDQAWEKIQLKLESKPGRGGYPDAETGTLWFQAGITGARERSVLRIEGVAIPADGTVGFGAYSNNHPLESLMTGRKSAKDAKAGLKKIVDWFKKSFEEDVRRAREERARQQPPEAEGAWSVVTLGKDHGYATEVQVFDSKSKAEAKARDLGNCYVVKGTQMWNEPLGQVEEHNREAPYKFFR